MPNLKEAFGGRVQFHSDNHSYGSTSFSCPMNSIFVIKLKIHVHYLSVHINTIVMKVKAGHSIPSILRYKLGISVTLNLA